MSMNVCNMKTIAAKARTENVINAQVIALCRRQRRRLRRNSLHWRLAQNVFHKNLLLHIHQAVIIFNVKKKMCKRRITLLYFIAIMYSS